jgi:BolA family transcriptional regulator, general stress-responsive regulator
MGFSRSIDAKLRSEFDPASLEVINESHLHAGHQEAFDGTGETHLRIRIVASAFEGMSRVARHRAINDLAAEELAAGLHALAIEARTPDEAAR